MPTSRTPKDRLALRQAVLRARLEGKTRPQIARDLGITEGVVGSILSNLLRRGAIEKCRNPTGPSPQRQDRWNRVLRLAIRGHSTEQIAAKLGLVPRTIMRDLADLRDLGFAVGPKRSPRQVD
jgi:DNA-binding NarL/FixJ family response regulator